MNVVAPFGFYGSGNIGDEATLQGFALLLRGHPLRARAWVASENPRHTARVEPAFRYYRYHRGRRRYWTSWVRRLAKAYVFPGGTPIMDGLGSWPLCDVVAMVRHAKRRGKQVVFVGTGTETLHRSELRQLVTEDLADYVAHWSVRSVRDRDRLVALGVAPGRVTVAADVAWLLPRIGTDFGEQTLGNHGLSGHRLVGVNVNAERALVAREPKLFEKLAAVLDRLIEAHGARVVFLCNEVREGETYDKAAAALVRSHMRHQHAAVALPNEYWAPQQMMSIIGSCDLTISTRYHFCLFSALQGVPFLALRRSDKVTDLCEDLGWPFGAALGSIDVEALADHGAALLKGGSHELDGLADRVAVMRERAQRNRVALDVMHARAGTASRPQTLRAAFSRDTTAT